MHTVKCNLVCLLVRLTAHVVSLLLPALEAAVRAEVKPLSGGPVDRNAARWNPATSTSQSGELPGTSGLCSMLPRMAHIPTPALCQRSSRVSDRIGS